MASVDHDLVERVARFGAHGSLIGIVAQPTTASNEKPAVVILNTGTIHRVGHHRMYVSMARMLAKAGHTVLRFDFSGVGDSADQSSVQTLLQSNLSDIGAAMQWLETTFGVSKVILAGLCSGADHAVLYGRSDPRVVGLVLIDPYIPATAWYFFDYISRRLLNLESWKGFSFRNSKIISRVSELLSYDFQADDMARHLASEGSNLRGYLMKVYGDIVQAQVQLLVICTGRHYAPRQTYREQFADGFSAVSFGDLLRLEYFDDADHTFSSLKSRIELTNLVEEWCESTDFDRCRSVRVRTG